MATGSAEVQRCAARVSRTDYDRQATGTGGCFDLQPVRSTRLSATAYSVQLLKAPAPQSGEARVPVANLDEAVHLREVFGDVLVLGICRAKSRSQLACCTACAGLTSTRLSEESHFSALISSYHWKACMQTAGYDQAVGLRP